MVKFMGPEKVRNDEKQSTVTMNTVTSCVICSVFIFCKKVLVLTPGQKKRMCQYALVDSR
jgi:hypothetical protein